MDSNKKINVMVDVVKLLLIITIACALVSMIVFLVSKDPANALYSFFVGPLTSLRRIGNVIEAASPLVFTALAVIIIFAAGQFSMIAEGAFFLGAAGAMAVAISFRLPSGIHPVVALIVAGSMGAIAAFIPAILKMKWKASELVISIMLNYVIQFFVIYLVSYHYREESSSTLSSLKMETSAELPTLINGTRIHLGIFIGFALCIFLWAVLYKTPFGTKLRISGDNPLFAAYAGIKVQGIILAAQIIGGALAGVGGGVELLGMYTRFKWSASPGYGWTGIVVALLARSNPMMVPIAALFIGYLNVGADIMARSSDVGREVVDIIQAVMMFLIAAEALLKGWRQHLIVKAAQVEEEKAVQS